MNSLIRFPMSFADPNDALQSLQQYLGSLQTRAFCDSTKRSMRTYLHSYLLFCQYFQFNPFPVSKPMYLLYLVFLSRSLSSYRSVVNYLGISTHINRSFGTSLAFLQDYDVYLTKRAVRRIMGDYIARKEPITVEILLQLFSKFDFNNHLHVCMRALFLVAFFSFLRISNLVPHKLSDIANPQACHLTPSNVTFTSVTYHTYQDYTISRAAVRNSLALYSGFSSLPGDCAQTVFSQCTATTSLSFICL